MFWTDWLSVGMIGAGAFFMLLSILMAVEMLPHLADYYRKRWVLLTLFKGFFFMGYLASIVILVMDLKMPLEFVTGVIFLGGALFVFLVIGLTRHTIIDLTNKEDALGELNATLEQKVLQRTYALGESMTDLNKEVLGRKRANRKIARMGEELRVILDTISTGIRVIGLDHTVTQVNRQLCLLTGLTREELLGKPCYTNFADDDCCSSAECRLRTILRTQSSYEVITTKTTRDGKKIHFRINSAPMLDSDGKVIGLLEDLQDISPLVKIQKEKEQVQNQLHRAVKLETGHGGVKLGRDFP